MASHDALVLLVVNFDAIAAVILCRLAGHAGCSKRCTLVARLAIEFGNADADGYLQRLVALEKAQRLSLLAHLVSEFQPLVRVGMRQQDAEVIAGKPRQHGAAGQISIEQTGESHYDFVTGPAPERVVDELQIVQVEVDDLVRVII